MKSIKNWDNKTWLSSNAYINSFNKFLIQNTKLNYESKILDIGCGRGKILENLSNKLNLINKPIGLDLEDHKDKSKKMIFKKIDALTYVKKTKFTFDLILIKQTIHLLKKKQAIKLLSICKSILNPNGKIIILSLDPSKNEIPTFQLMKKKLKNSLKKNKKIIKKFVFNVQISKTKYIQMIKSRYISTLLNFTNQQLNNGLNEIKKDYGKVLKFKDRLICYILRK